jgi:hypothetical protein
LEMAFIARSGAAFMRADEPEKEASEGPLRSAERAMFS